MSGPQSRHLLELEAADYFKLNLSQVRDLRPQSDGFLTGAMIAQRCGGKSKSLGKRVITTPMTRTKSTDTSGLQREPVGGTKTVGCRSLEIGSTLKSNNNNRKKTVQTQTTVFVPTRSLMDLSSNTSSPQSLPSISSSASVSPSLVCPHLTLDDIINRHHHISTSPHTIGLCKKCRLEPPPNVQSPLSPVFKPHSLSQPAGLDARSAGGKLCGMIKRRHSDHQAAPQRGPGQRLKTYGDESLDYWLEPEELSRLQLSPSLRNSVEFIRSHPTESARILRIYKNGQPYEKPLRVCIMRERFMSLAHLLDHINGRTIIPYGARYLFHLGGQLVYSENELKHNSIYIVSGTRNFNFKANAIICDVQRMSRVEKEASHDRKAVDRRIDQKAGRKSPIRRSAKKVVDSSTNYKPESIPSKPEHSSSSTLAALPHVLVSGEPQLPKRADKPLETRQVSTTASKKLISVRKHRPTKVKPTSETVEAPKSEKPPRNLGKPVPKRSRQPFNQDSISKSSENLKGITERTPVKRSKSIVRAKSELCEVTGKRKKNVTFVDLESPKPGPTKKVTTATKATVKQATTKVSKPILAVNTEANELIPEREPIKEVKDTKEDEKAEEPANPGSMPISTVVEEKKDQPISSKSEVATGDWQYPAGREHNVTPEERPISQMVADEVTSKSKVVTPSPSLSLTGDSLKLSISLDEQRNPQQQVTRQVRPVLGKPCNGTNLPANNFKLVWVNGININDKANMPEETQTPQQQALLSPQSAQTNPQLMSQQFKPKEAFHNWLCYSSRFDELVYPCGCLVVLWWVERDEQRYYSGHTLNVTALALCSQDKEVGASAQTGATCIHLWTLAKLETLRIVEDTQLMDLNLFSLSLRNSSENGCELAVAGCANKRIKVISYFLDLSARSSSNETTSKIEGKGTGSGRGAGRRESFLKAESSLNVSKPLKTNQLPLCVILASSMRGQLPAGLGDPLDDVLVSIGLQHFQVWYIDRKRRNLRPIEMKVTGGIKVKDITESLSCFARLSPSEILVGTNQGAINLIRFTCTETSKSNIISAIKSESNSSSYTCQVEIIPLHQPDNCTMTCLTRVSRNTFVSCDTSSAIRLWTMEQFKNNNDASQKGSIVCKPLDSLKIPIDLGFICSMMPTNRVKREPVLELILVSSRNVFISATMLINEPNSGSLNVIYDGHESPVTGLVSDRLSISSTALQADYFTCSLDCNICRWNGKMLVWKSILPSACSCLAIHPTGFVLAVGSTDGTVYILDKISGLLISYFPLTPVCINCLAYSRDGALLASGCANGSIFILPVYDRGLKYKKVSIFQSPHPVVSLQFSLDNKYILTSVTQGAYQELVLWDLPNFRYMCQNVRGTVDKIQWFDSICSGSEDVRAIWENKNLTVAASGNIQSNKVRSSGTIRPVINLSCHRLVRQQQSTSQQQPPPPLQNLVIACDTMGHLRLFQYPCYDNRQGFYEARVTSSAANCCRFLPPKNRSTSNEVHFVSTSLVGSIFLWSTC